MPLQALNATYDLVVTYILGSLSDDDDDDDAARTAKKTLGLDWQNNNCASASRLCIHLVPSLHDYDAKMHNFTFCGEREHRATTFFFLFLNFKTVL